MENRQFYYISNTKINLLYDQSNPVISKEISGEIGGGVSGNLASINGKLSTKKVTSVNIFGKLENVENNLRAADLVGGLFDNKPYIQGKAPLSSLYGTVAFDGALTWLYSYHDTNKHALYIFLFYGSAHNIVGMEEIPHTITMSHSEIFIQNSLLRMLNNEKEKIELHGDDVEWFKRIKRWEAFEYLRHLYRISLNSAYSCKFLVRVDNRETITKANYLKSDLVNTFYNNNDIKREEKRLFSIPNDVDYIVYVYGSPIYVEHLIMEAGIHIIDGKTLLYLSKEEIESFVDKKNGWINESEALNYIVKRLWDSGLLKESRLIRKEYWDIYKNNHWKNIGKEAFIELVRKYTTPIPPL